MKKIIVVLALLLSCSGLSMYAQNIIVQGEVLDAISAEPIVGASVVVVGTNNGVLTDSDGKYVISAPSDGLLRASALGYDDQTQFVNGRASVNFVLSPSHGVDSVDPVQPDNDTSKAQQ